MQQEVPSLLQPDLVEQSDSDFILTALRYFGIFNHPLHEEELRELCGLDAVDFRYRMDQLLAQSEVYCAGSHYSISAHVEEVLKQRLEKEARALRYRKKLPLFAMLISLFPFVRGVAVSGSLNKGVMSRDGDIDYFIITSPGRLWTCRTLLILFKKICLLNSRKYFCLNYFVDTNNLMIKDRNLFTAMEIYYLEPLYQKDFSFSEFFEKNEWIRDLIPSQHSASRYSIKHRSGSSLAERFATALSSDRAERFFHRLTLKRWHKKYGHFDPDKFERTMRSTVGVSKHHPRDFQEFVLSNMKPD